jgi:hypothetical protein
VARLGADATIMKVWVGTAMAWHITNPPVTASVLNWEQLRPKEAQVGKLYRFSDPRCSVLPADIYCYICDDSKLDPEIATHLSTFGINVQTLTKTEKSMTELVNLLSIYLFRSTLITLPSNSNTT